MVSGLLLNLANPPADIGPLAFVALLPLLWSLRGAGPGRGALAGFAFGIVYYGLLLDWLMAFGSIAWLPLVVSQALYAAAFGALAPLATRLERPLRSAVLLAALWTAIDWVRAVWPVGGFTWGGLGYTQHGNGLILPVATVTGVWGVTFAVILVNALLLEAGLGRRPGPSRPRLPAKALVAGALGACLLPAMIPVPGASGPPIDVAVVQGNVPRALASDRLLQSDRVAQNHIALNRTLASDPPDLAVWPENALSGDPAHDPALAAAVSGSIRDVGATTIVGAISPAPGGSFYNQALLYAPDGQIVDRYSKIHLVPFGEYIPWRSLLGWTQRYRHGLATLSPGNRVHDFRVGTTLPICFENTFPDLFRRFVSAGASLVVVTTNDSSYLYSPASREHVIMSQLRAVETGRWIVQGAISGESAIVNAHGQVVRHTGLFVPAILRANVPTATARTLYVRLGDWFPLACAAAVAALFGLRAVRGVGERRRRAAAGGPTADPPPGEGGQLCRPRGGAGRTRGATLYPGPGRPAGGGTRTVVPGRDRAEGSPAAGGPCSARPRRVGDGVGGHEGRQIRI